MNKKVSLNIIILILIIITFIMIENVTAEAIPDNLEEKTVNQLSSDEKLLQLQQKLEREGNLWVAGETEISRLSDSEKIKRLGLILTDEEIQEINQKTKKGARSTRNRDLPDFFDWRNRHGGLDYTTPVKNQGGCGSCWAFSAIAALESGINIYYNNASLDFDLSEQDLVSCFTDNGCSGVWSSEIEDIFENYFQTTGVATEDCFQYTATNNNCNNKCTNWQDSAWRINYYESPDLTIDDIKEALMEFGPLTVGMYVYSDFYNYQGGIYYNTYSRFMGGHAVLIVGFGIYDGTEYWIVKNSWGENWGEAGYFKIRMGEVNIAKYYAYVEIEPEYLNEILENPLRLCTDTDNDGYCYWGIGEKPDTCPQCNDLVYDCDDSNETIFENCGENTEETGFLSIETQPNHAKVYVRDLNIDSWFYRGQTPIEFELNTGEREIKVSHCARYDWNSTINIAENQEETLNIILEHDSLFLEGWPVSVDGSTYMAKKTADINQDNHKEILQSNRNGLFVFLDNGSILFQNQISESRTNPSGVVIGDINNDGADEIISLLNGSDLYVFDTEGNILEGFPIHYFGSTNSIFGQTISLGDIDGNGFLDIVFAKGEENWDDEIYNNSEIYVVDYQGNNLEGWPYTFSLVDDSHFVAANDVDFDGKCEIISLTGSKIYVFEENGSVKSGWPIQVPQGHISGLAMADINNDSNLEIFFSRVSSDSKLYGYYSNGTSISGWPKSTNEPLYGFPVIGNIDENDDLEIVVCGDRRCYAYHQNGNNVDGWPVYNTIGWANKFPIIVDIDGDGNGEIFIAFNEELYLYEGDGTPIWSKRLNGRIQGPLLVDDLDLDGDMELIVSDREIYGEYFIYVLDLEYPYYPENMQWPMYMQNLYNTGTYDTSSSLFLKGDIDGNNNINSYDSSLVLEYVTLIDTDFEEWQLVAADVDCNDIIDAYDAALILRYSAGMIEEFPCNGGERYDPEDIDKLVSCISDVKLNIDGKIVDDYLINCLKDEKVEDLPEKVLKKEKAEKISTAKNLAGGAYQQLNFIQNIWTVILNIFR